MEPHIHSNLPVHRCRFWVRLMGQATHSRTHRKDEAEESALNPKSGLSGPARGSCVAAVDSPLSMLHSKGLGLGRWEVEKDGRKVLTAALLWKLPLARTQVFFDSCQWFAQKVLAQETKVIKHSARRQSFTQRPVLLPKFWTLLLSPFDSTKYR